MRKFLKRIVAFSLVLTLGIGLIGCAGGYDDTEANLRVGALEEIITSLQKENTTLKEQTFLLEKAIFALKNENASLEDKAAVLTSALSLLQDRDASNSQKIVALEAAKVALLGEVATISANNTALAELSAELTISIGEILAVNSSQDQKISALESANSTLSSQVASLLSDLGGLQTTNIDLLTAIDDLQGEIGSLNSQLSTAIAAITQLGLDLATANGNLLAVTDQLAIALTEIGKLQQFMDEIYVEVYKAFMNPYGYASLVVTNRVNIPETIVTNEVEFLDALYDARGTSNTVRKSDKIIRIDADVLNLGWIEVSAQVLAETGQTMSQRYGTTIFKQDAMPTEHPILIAKGVTEYTMEFTNHFMIYSNHGAVIKHFGTTINYCNDVVIRNLDFQELWEWDESSRGMFNNRDWDTFVLNGNVDGFWFDHNTVQASYDGLIDAKNNCKNITISWCDFTFKPNDFMRAQIEDLDARLLSETPGTSRYPSYWAETRVKADAAGVSMEELIAFFSSGNKSFNLGNSGSNSNYNYSMLTVTFHHINAANIKERFPRMRKGDAHMYNIKNDGSALYNLLDDCIFNYQNMSICVTENAAVLLENSHFINVDDPIRTNQQFNDDDRYTGRYLVLNSIYELPDSSVYYNGNSNEPGTPWATSSSRYPEREFYLRNDQEIPYNYKEFMVDAIDLEDLFETTPYGAGTLKNYNWKLINPELGFDGTFNESHKIDDYINLTNSSQRLNVPNANYVVGAAYSELNPTVYNYYNNDPSRNGALSNVVYVRDVDYTLVVDYSELDMNTPGLYTVKYEFTNLHRSDDVVVREQQVVVSAAGVNIALDSASLSRMIDGAVHLTARIFSPTSAPVSGNYTLYAYASSNASESAATIKTGNAVTASGTVTVPWINAATGQYIHFLAVQGANESAVYSLEVETEETIVPIFTTQDFANMLKFDTKGMVFKLQNDIIFPKDIRIAETPTLEGVLDGNGYSVIGLKSVAFGVFRLIQGGVIKDITFDHCYVDGSNDSASGLLSQNVSGIVRMYDVNFIGSGARQYRASGVGVIAGSAIAGSDVTLWNISYDGAGFTANDYNVNGTSTVGGFFGTIAGKVTAENILIKNVSVVARNLDGTNAPYGATVGLFGGNVSGTVSITNLIAINCSVGGTTAVAGLFGNAGTAANGITLNKVYVEVEFVKPATGANWGTNGYIHGGGGTGSRYAATNNVYYVRCANDGSIPTTGKHTWATVVTKSASYITDIPSTVFTSALWTITTGDVVLN